MKRMNRRAPLPRSPYDRNIILLPFRFLGLIHFDVFVHKGHAAVIRASKSLSFPPPRPAAVLVPLDDKLLSVMRDSCVDRLLLLRPNTLPIFSVRVGGLYLNGSSKLSGGLPDMVRKSRTELNLRNRPPGPSGIPDSSFLYLCTTMHRSQLLVV